MLRVVTDLDDSDTTIQAMLEDGSSPPASLIKYICTNSLRKYALNKRISSSSQSRGRQFQRFSESRTRSSPQATLARGPQFSITAENRFPRKAREASSRLVSRPTVLRSASDSPSRGQAILDNNKISVLYSHSRGRQFSAGSESRTRSSPQATLEFRIPAGPGAATPVCLRPCHAA